MDQRICAVPLTVMAFSCQLAFAAPPPAKPKPKTQIELLKQSNQQQAAKLAALENQIQSLQKMVGELNSKLGGAAAPAAAQVARSPTAPIVVASNQTAQNAAPAAVAAPRPVLPPLPPAPDSKTSGDAPKSVEDIYQTASGFNSSSRYSFEAGLTYSHFDTRELKLSGFLALDSIFLGNINLDRTKQDTYTLDLTGRWSPTPRWQFEINAPIVAREANYFSGGAGGAGTSVSEGSTSRSPQLGDVSVGVAYKLFQETLEIPDTTISLNLRTPTGKEPYGIKLKEVENSNGNLMIPTELPTGNGAWGLTGGLAVVKTVDPAVIFANIGYTYYFKNSYDDISSNIDTTQPGEVQQGSSIQFGAGTAFALNEKLSLGLSYSQQLVSKSRVRSEGGPWNDVTGSDANVANFNVGMTYAINKNLSVIPNLAIGLTPEAANYAVSVKMPYNF
ncbi:transporter [Jeongeupia wiesaeckerbachi]|uniref:transporter n=1 Tax=Jeongeupia wiesaeckerbachi TaxID=3051218 RepID=UPI003D807133